MTKVARDQFKWDGDRLIHEPTGAKFHRNSDFVNYGRADEDLEDGTCYEREDVLEMAHQLILDSKDEE